MLGRTVQAIFVAATLGLLAGCAGTHPEVVSIPVRATPRPAPEPAAEPDQAEGSMAEPAGVLHVVERGQTLWRIAHTYRVELDELAQINRIDDVTRIEPGDLIWIPGARSTRVVAVAPAVGTGATIAGADSWIWPVTNGAVISHFGAPRGGRTHRGVDIRGRHGQPVLAASDGTVVYSGASMRGYGKTIIVHHGEGVQTLYAHNSDLLVDHGDPVRRGQTIARVGKTGNASAEHCHFEVRQSDRAIDPLSIYDLRPEEGR